MTKKLKELAEIYKPKAKGEENFVKKHVVVKHKDRNGNGDDVFNATNIKSVDKSPEHGYNAGEDSAVYESEVLAELSRAAVKRYKGAALDNLNYHSKQWDRLARLHSFSLGQEKAFDKHDKESEKRYKGIRLAKDKLGEEVLDEISIDLKQKYMKHGDNWLDRSRFSGTAKGERRARILNKTEKDLVKRGVKPQGHLSGDAKLHAEEVITELSKKTLASYINKAAVKNLAHAGSLATQAHDEDKDKRDEAGKTAKKLVNKLDGIHRATKRLAKD